jgi:hypothetical protein
MGKGIILSVSELEKHFELLLTPEHISRCSEDVFLIFNRLIKDHINSKYSISFLGHDAFRSYSGDMEILSGTENGKQLELTKISKHDVTKLCYYTKFCFVGVYNEIPSEEELEYEVTVPELLYGLPALLPGIMELYPKLQAQNCEELIKEFPQYKPCIWTFAGDCHCCT